VTFASRPVRIAGTFHAASASVYLAGPIDIKVDTLSNAPERSSVVFRVRRL
jgi:hypothetical protein